MQHQVGILRSASTVLADLRKQGKVEVVGGVYDLESGRVTLLDVVARS